MLPDEQLRLSCLDMATRGALGDADKTLAAAKKFYKFIKPSPKPPAPEKPE